MATVLSAAMTGRHPGVQKETEVRHLLKIISSITHFTLRIRTSKRNFFTSSNGPNSQVFKVQLNSVHVGIDFRDERRVLVIIHQTIGENLVFVFVRPMVLKMTDLSTVPLTHCQGMSRDGSLLYSGRPRPTARSHACSNKVRFQFLT